MATVTNLTLAIQVVNNGPNLEAQIEVEYDIVFSSFDQNSTSRTRSYGRCVRGV